MYYSVATLIDIAKSNILIGQGARLSAFSSDPANDLALCVQAPGLVLSLVGKGRLRLHFHCHAWSGRAHVLAGSQVIVVELFSADPTERWVEIALPDETPSDLTVTLLAECHPEAQSAQAWVRGIEFETRQHWHPAVIPVTRTCDIAVGRVGTFLIPRFDEVIGKSIKNTGVWAGTDLDFFADKIGPGDTVLDIGANIGHHTVFFSKAVGPSGKVIGFEPQLNIFRYASANAVMNGCANTTILQGCLGDAEGETRMASISYDQETNFGALGVSIGEDPFGELVPVWTLDGLLERGILTVDRIDFVKIDVQSFELYVLRGAERTFRMYKPTIFLEISPYWMKERGYDYNEIYELLRQIGYDFYHFQHGAGIVDGVRQWSGSKSEEWDVVCTPL